MLERLQDNDIVLSNSEVHAIRSFLYICTYHSFPLFAQKGKEHLLHFSLDIAIVYGEVGPQHHHGRIKSRNNTGSTRLPRCRSSFHSPVKHGFIVQAPRSCLSYQTTHCRSRTWIPKGSGGLLLLLLRPLLALVHWLLLRRGGRGLPLVHVGLGIPIALLLLLLLLRLLPSLLKRRITMSVPSRRLLRLLTVVTSATVKVIGRGGASLVVLAALIIKVGHCTNVEINLREDLLLLLLLLL
jgi:hypothetical protein